MGSGGPGGRGGEPAMSPAKRFVVEAQFVSLVHHCAASIRRIT